MCIRDSLDLVRGDWRMYNRNINQNIVESQNTTVDLSRVNILENENIIKIKKES